MTAASSAEEDPSMVVVPLHAIQPRREESVSTGQVIIPVF